MTDVTIRRAVDADIPALDKLLYQVHKVHSDVRPDIFKAGAKKYTDEELKVLLADDHTPVFHKQFLNDNNMTDIKTLYIDDLCVDESSRGLHIGQQLYAYVIDYARAAGYYNVTLNVWADNKPALRFYEKLGLRVQKIGMEKIL